MACASSAPRHAHLLRDCVPFLAQLPNPSLAAQQGDFLSSRLLRTAGNLVCSYLSVRALKSLSIFAPLESVLTKMMQDQGSTCCVRDRATVCRHLSLSLSLSLSERNPAIGAKGFPRRDISFFMFWIIQASLAFASTAACPFYIRNLPL